MKNLLKILVVALITVAGVQTTTAQSLSQDQDRPEVIAKNQVAEMSETLNLTGEQQRYLFRYHTSYISNMKKYIEPKNQNSDATIADKEKLQNELKKYVQKVLDENQYKKWLEMQDFN
ncbi:hypothetical protein MG296_01300 [Flavobacteriaceae bacterium TK19130]|nr:hypothetical protein [Thermobacterium salinum]